MERWYATYWAQSWYRNTYLVRHPRQIGRESSGARDWNNVYDAGCNFTCIAMMLGIDPARLASELASESFFRADREAPARRIDGTRGPLVWDRNAPHERLPTVTLASLWLSPLRRRVTVKLTFVAEELASDHTDGKRIVGAAHRRGEHVIAGAQEHSLLVAGRSARDFYLWDPDDTSVPVECSLAGKLTLGDLFGYYAAREPIAFWRYRIARKLHAKRAPPKRWRFGQ